MPVAVAPFGGSGMSRETVAMKAARYLGEGRIIIRQLDEYGGTVQADARGNGSIYGVSRDERGRWRCDCATRGPKCCHIFAVKLVTALEPRETS
jgi:hypothetical protein